jgi:APA family basic amino acid/polyamine antiporter
MTDEGDNDVTTFDETEESVTSAGQEDGVFLRQSTGLVRLMGTRQTVVYNTMITTIVLGAALTFLLAPYAFPGANVALGVLITGVIGMSMMAAYAMLASSMPRSGGDYVFQSRLVHSGVGFVLVIVGFVIFLAFWMCLAGWFLAVMALSPFATTLGIEVGADWMVDFGTWAATPWGVTIISLAALVVAYAVLARGIRTYLRVQSVLWVMLLITFVTVWVLLLANPRADFIQTFDSYIVGYGGDPQYYESIVASAKEEGYAGYNFSLWDTIGVAPVVWTAMAWSMWSVITAGELKGARQFKNHAVGMMGALAIVTVTIALTALLLARSAGNEFLGALGFLYYSGSDALSGLPAPPFFGVLAAMLAGNPILIVLLAIGFCATAFQILIGMAWGASRILMSMAFDRLLPEKLGEVSDRNRTPTAALLVIMAMSVVFVVLYSHTKVSQYTLAVTLTSVLAYMGSMVAAIVFPYRAPDLFKTSPAAKYKLGGMPLIVILGAIGLAFNGLLVYFYLTKDELFVNDTGSLLMIAGIYLAVAIYFVGRRSWLKRNDFDPDIAFSRIPPE